MNRIVSLTIKQLEDATDLNYLHRRQHLSELQEPKILRAFANTLIFRIPSSKFNENSIYWHVYVMFEDFYSLAKDEDISLLDAIKYVISDGDVHAACTCPAYRYWAHEYYGTQLKYTYGPYKTNMAPTRNNTEMRSMICKHQQKVFDWIRANPQKIEEAFFVYYSSLRNKKSKDDYHTTTESSDDEVHEQPVSVTDDTGTTYVSLAPEVSEQENTSEQETIDNTTTDNTTDDSVLGEEDDGNSESDELQ